MGTIRKKAAVFLAWGAGLVLALLAAAVLLAPRLVNTDAFKQRAFAELERSTGARISYERAEVSFFPRILVAAHAVTFDMADRARGKAALVRAEATLLPLLAGRLRIGSVVVDSPTFRVRLPARKEGEEPFAREKAEKEVASALATLRDLAPGAHISIRNGAVELTDAAGAVLSLSGLQAEASLPPGRLTVRLRCASEYWDALSVDAGLLPEGLRGTARIETAGLKLDALVGRLAPGTAPWLGKTVVSMRGRLESEGLRSVAADLSGALPALTVRRGGRSRTVRVNSVAGTVALEENGARAVLTELSFAEPTVRLSGELTVDHATRRIEATVTGRDLAIAPVRAAVLAIAGDVPQVREVLDIVRDGAVPRFTASVGGNSWSDLASADALEFRARVAGGTIFIPGIDFTLARVSGEASMSRGVLSGRDISAGLGGARCDHGSFRMGIMEDDPSLYVDVRLDTPAGEVLPRMRAIVSPGKAEGFIDRIGDLRGNASGRLLLKGRLSSLQAIVTISSMQLAGSYPGIPFPIAIERGQVRFSTEEELVSLSGVQGTLGRSTFSGLSGRLGTGTEPVLSVRLAGGYVDLGELFPWLSRTEALQDSMGSVRSVRGAVHIDGLAIDGPAYAPGEWKFDVSGDLPGVGLVTSLVPGPVSVAQGRFHLRPRDASLSDARASVLDATFQGSLEVHWTRDGVEAVSSSLDAQVGPEAARWARSRYRVPGAINFRAPFDVRQLSLAWEKGWKVSWKGDLDLPEGPAVSLSGLAAPGEVRMDYVIRDAASDTRLSVSSDNGALRIRYHGVLTAGTAEKLVRLPDTGPFRIRGDVDLNLDWAHPERSSAHGTVEARDLAIPWARARPLRIQALSLSGEGHKVRVNSSGLSWDNVPLSVTGTAAFDGEGVVVDADVAAGDLHVEPLLGTVEAQGAGEETDRFTVPESFALRGTVRLKADSVAYGKFVWRPLRAEARLDNGVLRVAVTDANLCGVTTLGSIVLGAGDPAVSLSMSGSGKEVEKVTACLLGENVLLTGGYDASARLEGKGSGDALLHSLRGPLEVTMKDGRILKLTVLSRIFSVLGVTDLFHGELPDIDRKGFAYRALVLRGEVKGGKLSLEEASVNAPSMGIAATGDVDLLGKDTDLKVLVAPFTTLDWIIRRIPVVRYILGGTLVSIPVTVKGDILDPKVTPMSPTAVGEGLLGVMTRTLKLPVKAVDAFRSEEDTPQGP
jgi:hypothetical protein